MTNFLKSNLFRTISSFQFEAQIQSHTVRFGSKFFFFTVTMITYSQGQPVVPGGALDSTPGHAQIEYVYDY